MRPGNCRKDAPHLGSLREEELGPLGPSVVYPLAKELKLARSRLNDIVLERRGMLLALTPFLHHHWRIGYLAYLLYGANIISYISRSLNGIPPYFGLGHLQ